MSNVETILESIEKLTLLEAAELVKAMEEKFGVSAAAPVAVAAAPAAAGAAAPADDPDAEVSVILASVPADKKIAVLKEVRNITGLGLKEAKDLVEAAPKAVKENIKKAEDEEIKKTLEAAGAGVEIK
jgi:large subunit ribosomal protein L7/L12